VSFKPNVPLLLTGQLCSVAHTALELEVYFIVPLAQLFALDFAQFRRLPFSGLDFVHGVLLCPHLDRNDRLRPLRVVFAVNDPIQNPAQLFTVVDVD
jgi:hypothetical protein